MIGTISYDQQEILKNIMTLYDIDQFDVDVTYGSGVFYKDEIKAPKHKFDIEPLSDDVVEANSGDIPLEDNSIKSLVFDPPFLTYVRQGRSGNGSMIMSGRFSGYWTYQELTDHYQSTFDEAARVLQNNGYMVVKCQDIIHNHKLHPTHMYVTQWAQERGFQLEDMFILAARHRLPNAMRTQKHARIFHSYFMVFKRRRSNRAKTNLDVKISQSSL